MIARIGLVFAMATFGASFASCKKEAAPAVDEAGKTAPAEMALAPPAEKAVAAADEASKEPVEKVPAAVPPTAKATPLLPVMTPYEQCRQLLANDTAKGANACARGIGEAAEGAAAALPKNTHKHLSAVGKAAKKLAEADEENLAEVRLAFGDVSKPMVALVGAMPDEVAHAYHVFECPMAKGYKRWIQPTATLENPYMGQEMLTCGSAVATHGEGGGGHEHDHGESHDDDKHSGGHKH